MSTTRAHGSARSWGHVGAPGPGPTGPSVVRGMSRFVLDAPALWRLVDDDVQVAAAHSLVAPSGLRSQALQLLHEAVQRGELNTSR